METDTDIFMLLLALFLMLIAFAVKRKKFAGFMSTPPPLPPRQLLPPIHPPPPPGVPESFMAALRASLDNVDAVVLMAPLANVDLEPPVLERLTAFVLKKLNTTKTKEFMIVSVNGGTMERNAQGDSRCVVSMMIYERMTHVSMHVWVTLLSMGNGSMYIVDISPATKPPEKVDTIAMTPFESYALPLSTI